MKTNSGRNLFFAVKKHFAVRKIFTLPAAALLTASLGACGGNAPGTGDSSDLQNKNAVEEISREDGKTQDIPSDGGTEQGEFQGGGLRLLYKMGNEGCNTREGYYYLTSEPEKLVDGNYGTHMMYMDFAAQQEIYLCSNAGCKHDSPDCPAVFLYDDFPPYTSPLFIHGDGLYILSKEMDHDGGSMWVESYGQEEGGSTLGYGNVEENSTILYRMNLDGTEREKIHTFDLDVTLEDYVLGDENGIYVIAKKLSAERDGSNTYITSSERRLLYLDFRTGEESEVCRMDFEGNISWRLAGCYGRSLVMEGTDYGREVSREEMYDDDAWKNLYLNSQEVFATFDLDSLQLAEKYRMSNRGESSHLIDGGMLYVSDSEDGSVKAIDLRNESERIICRPENDFFHIGYLIGDKLCCINKDWDSAYCYVDINTGEISYSSLVNKSLGWSLDFRAVLDSEVLVIYDYDAEPSAFNDGAYEIKRYQYGLISKSDLYAGNDNYRPIQMIGKGE